MEDIVVRWHQYPQSLPDKDARYLVTMDFYGHTYTDVERFIPGVEWPCAGNKVIAWAELPKPFIGETE